MIAHCVFLFLLCTAAALAVSGGVDSMALAYLCSQMKRTDPFLRVADNPVSKFVAVVVDHGYREGCAQEAANVARYLRARLNMKTEIFSINWRRILGDDAASRLHEMTNFETHARVQRYRKLAALSRLHIRSLLLAHHEDDQYETVLIRLLTGRGPRGLRGIETAVELPHTEDFHGSYRSGLIDDQARSKPLYRMTPTRRQQSSLRSALEDGLFTLQDGVENDLRQGTATAGDMRFLDRSYYDVSGPLGEPKGRSVTPVPGLERYPTEDGGMMMYRPLLGFPKDRLIATCQENGIPWFEDSTNADPTVTMRNAVRHMVANHQLPVALQKPAVLALLARCRRAVLSMEAEASQLFERLTIHDFQPNFGTAVVGLPELPHPKARRRFSIYATTSRSRRTERMRDIAALIIRKLIKIVTPSSTLPPVPHLGEFVARLFPALAEPAWESLARRPPKAFTLCGVHFVPLHPSESDRYGGRLVWHLSRAPYKALSVAPLPMLVCRGNWGHYKWWKRPAVPRDRHKFQLFDGRFWIRVANKMPNFVAVGPVTRLHLSEFRKSLPRAERRRLNATLRRNVPGGVRFTLPALYAVGDIDWALDTKASDGEDGSLGDGEYDQASDEARLYAMHREIKEAARYSPEPHFRMVAIPAVDVHLPGIQRRLFWEVRYRNVDREVLEGLERTKLGRMSAALGLRPGRGRSRGGPRRRAGPRPGSRQQPRRTVRPRITRRGARLILVPTEVGKSHSTSASLTSSGAWLERRSRDERVANQT